MILSKPAYGVFQTADGHHVSVAALENHFWQQLVQALELNDIPADWADYAARSAQAERVNACVEQAMTRLSAADACARLRAVDVPYAQVVEPGALSAHPHHHDREIYTPRADITGDAAFARFPVTFQSV